MEQFTFLTSDQAEKFLQIDPQLINIAKISDDYKTKINQIIQVTDSSKRRAQSSKPVPEYEKL